MTYKLNLTWHEARKCWKKYYKGKYFYLGKGRCRSKSDRQGYKTAWDEWIHIRASINKTHNDNHLQPDSSNHEMVLNLALPWDKVPARDVSSSTMSINTKSIRELAKLYLHTLYEEFEADVKNKERIQ